VRRPQWLRELSALKGGRFIASPEDAPTLESLDATRTESLGIERSAPFGEPLWALLLLLLACLEWGLRRLWGEA